MSETPETAKQKFIGYFYYILDYSHVDESKLAKLEELVKLAPDIGHSAMAKIYASKGILDKSREHSALISDSRNEELEELAESNVDMNFLIGERYVSKGDLENAMTHFILCSEYEGKLANYARQRIQEIKS